MGTIFYGSYMMPFQEREHYGILIKNTPRGVFFIKQHHFYFKDTQGPQFLQWGVFFAFFGFADRADCSFG
jgi:hypothetical protein